eukprot:Hpha_TRINITY_DN10275_c0_g1::TRINITY_DN10275_c0_g1_i1::g.35224::m.35224
MSCWCCSSRCSSIASSWATSPAAFDFATSSDNRLHSFSFSSATFDRCWARCRKGSISRLCTANSAAVFRSTLSSLWKAANSADDRLLRPSSSCRDSNCAASHIAARSAAIVTSIVSPPSAPSATRSSSKLVTLLLCTPTKRIPGSKPARAAHPPGSTVLITRLAPSSVSPRGSEGEVFVMRITLSWAPDSSADGPPTPAWELSFILSAAFCAAAWSKPPAFLLKLLKFGDAIPPTRLRNEARAGCGVLAPALTELAGESRPGGTSESPATEPPSMLVRGGLNTFARLAVEASACGLFLAMTVGFLPVRRVAARGRPSGVLNEPPKLRLPGVLGAWDSVPASPCDSAASPIVTGYRIAPLSPPPPPAFVSK